jgi:hypothetical protein
VIACGIHHCSASPSGKTSRTQGRAWELCRLAGTVGPMAASPRSLLERAQSCTGPTFWMARVENGPGCRNSRQRDGTGRNGTDGTAELSEIGDARACVCFRSKLGDSNQLLPAMLSGARLSQTNPLHAPTLLPSGTGFVPSSRNRPWGLLSL